MSTSIYSIETPVILGSEDTWGTTLNNQTFVGFDSYMRDNIASYISINASGTTASGQIRLFSNLNLPDNYWSITHQQNSESGIFSIRKNQTLSTPLIFVSGGAWYKTQNISPFTNYGPGGILYMRGKITGEGMFDGIGDWISSSTVDWTDVDVSDDGVPKGASAVMIRIETNSSATITTLRVRKNGGSEDSNDNNIYSHKALSVFHQSESIVPVDANAIFEAKWVSSWTSTINNAYVAGYFL